MKYFNSVRERTVGFLPAVFALQQSQREGRHGMWPTVIGAFFVVVFVGYVLSLSSSSQAEASAESTAEINTSEWFEEAFAYQPGQFITTQVRAGYIGN